MCNYICLMIACIGVCVFVICLLKSLGCRVPNHFFLERKRKPRNKARDLQAVIPSRALITVKVASLQDLNMLCLGLKTESTG